MDYRAVNPQLGDMADLNALTSALHERGISLCLDVVLNLNPHFSPESGLKKMVDEWRNIKKRQLR